MTDNAELDDPSSDDSDSLESNPLTRGRLAKYRRVMEDGWFPYASGRTDTAAELAERFGNLEPGTSTGATTTIAGRLMNTREMGKLIFAPVADV
ncbi:MAG: hypothetical protein DRJ28_08175, partial [Actinobacteria bacterium]